MPGKCPDCLQGVRKSWRACGILGKWFCRLSRAVRRDGKNSTWGWCFTLYSLGLCLRVRVQWRDRVLSGEWKEHIHIPPPPPPTRPWQESLSSFPLPFCVSVCVSVSSHPVLIVWFSCIKIIRASLPKLKVTGVPGSSIPSCIPLLLSRPGAGDTWPPGSSSEAEARIHQQVGYCTLCPRWVCLHTPVNLWGPAVSSDWGPASPFDVWFSSWAAFLCVWGPSQPLGNLRGWEKAPWIFTCYLNYHFLFIKQNFVILLL